MLTQYHWFIPIWHPLFIGAHFAALALALSFFASAMRGIFTGTGAVFLLSELTFSVYLFHNWRPSRQRPLS
ncbi:hypothetical protein LZ009_09670 [Ramlibacter sp. XY19]|uniref:hypothetical protein n=1 Tax=Ramlibacter paludis TaxID=2908000 RepID=UPI0023DA2B6E|nr:hypothetical protein [Ramlibacter paludis]MCG2593048.1 hypothetical protein [Ramlibacter paludis]